MKVTAIVLSHYKEREKNLIRIIEDLRNGIVKPDSIVVINDNPDILPYRSPGVIYVNISHNTNPIVRFSFATVLDSDYFLFLDDDLTVEKKTLKYLVENAKINPNSILGFEGSSLNKDSDDPYTKGEEVSRVSIPTVTDIIIRTYFVPKKALFHALKLRTTEPNLPLKSIDDVLLCLGYSLCGKGRSIVIPLKNMSGVKELDFGGVGQCIDKTHYINRDATCRYLLDKYGN